VSCGANAISASASAMKMACRLCRLNKTILTTGSENLGTRGMGDTKNTNELATNWLHRGLQLLDATALDLFDHTDHRRQRFRSRSLGKYSDPAAPPSI
jgi:hypothetical protein